MERSTYTYATSHLQIKTTSKRTDGRRRATPRRARLSVAGTGGRRSTRRDGQQWPRRRARDLVGTGPRPDPEICAPVQCRRVSERDSCGPLPCPFPFPFSFSRTPSASDRSSSHGDRSISPHPKALHGLLLLLLHLQHRIAMPCYPGRPPNKVQVGSRNIKALTMQTLS